MTPLPIDGKAGWEACAAFGRNPEPPPIGRCTLILTVRKKPLGKSQTVPLLSHLWFGGVA